MLICWPRLWGLVTRIGTRGSLYVEPRDSVMIREGVATLGVTFVLRIRSQWPGSEVDGGVGGSCLGLGVSGCGWG